MAKVVKYGKDHEGWSEEFKCVKCWATVLVNKEDLFFTQKKIVDMRYKTEIKYICPACGFHNSILKYQHKSHDASTTPIKAFGFEDIPRDFAWLGENQDKIRKYWVYSKHSSKVKVEDFYRSQHGDPAFLKND